MRTLRPSIALGLLAVLVLAGCTQAPPPRTGPPPEMWIPAPDLPEGKVALTFYRPSRFFGAALNTSIYIDSVEIADLDNGTCVTALVDAGRHELHSDEDVDALWVEVAAGREYFYRVNIQTGFWKGHGILLPMAGEPGRKEFLAAGVKQGKDIRVREMVIPSPSRAAR